jgi:hypothetical protein
VPNRDLPQSVTSFHDNETGSYTVFDDCSGETKSDPPAIGAGGAVIKLRLVLSDAGRVIHTTVSYARPPNAAGPVPALIHSEGRNPGPARITTRDRPRRVAREPPSPGGSNMTGETRT